jgi:diphthine-ammonia ligase
MSLDIARHELPVTDLVTFAPPNGSFRAHPLMVMRAQAAALRIPHRVIEIAEPYEAGYFLAFEALAAEGVTHVITGDIDRVDGRPNWVRERCAGLPIEVVTPLWDRDRASILEELRARGFRVVISCVRPPLPASLCGQFLDDALPAIRASGADLCGENGEYHTLVVDGPGFARPITLDAAPVTGEDGLTTLSVRGVS